MRIVPIRLGNQYGLSLVRGSAFCIRECYAACCEVRLAVCLVAGVISGTAMRASASRIYYSLSDNFNPGNIVCKQVNHDMLLRLNEMPFCFIGINTQNPQFIFQRKPQRLIMILDKAIFCCGEVFSNELFKSIFLRKLNHAI